MTDGPFPQDALEANRAGRLTDMQVRSLRGMSGRLRRGELQFAIGLVVVGLIIWFAPGPARYATAKPLIGIACLIIAGFLVVRSFLGADPLTSDLRNQRVESVEGAITKWIIRTPGGRGSTYYFEVAGQRVVAWRAAYDAAPQAGIVRIFYLPHSRRLVNMERLPDRPLPPEMTTDPQQALKDISHGMKSHDQIRAAEARAELAAMGNAMKSELEKAAAPPPAEARDPRPLAQAILGAWSAGLMTITFVADGSVVATLPGGRTRSGHWSVDESGRLVSDATGSHEAADAWVAGNQLTISSKAGGLTFQRISQDG